MMLGLAGLALLVFVTRKPDIPLEERVAFEDDKIIIDEPREPECSGMTRTGLETVKKRSPVRIHVDPTGECKSC